ncbi:MAG: aminofutalosine synthase MqnE [Thermodesulfovibrionales bacterium]|nr:aminofutalosine synthase MqnE [Thermodesulfovibrionales bacterium]
MFSFAEMKKDKAEEEILKKRLSKDEALSLYTEVDIFVLGELACRMALLKNRNHAFFIRNIHINPTNLCINRCRFCAFSRSRGEPGAFEFTVEDIIEKISFYLSKDPGLREVHIVGGLHPEWKFERYINIISSIKNTFPFLQIKAYTATEIDHFSKISGLSIEKVLEVLRLNGLDIMPGGGAEIFDEGVRNLLCPEKISAQRWLEIMEIAHRMGIRSNATMLYGHGETPEHRIDHLLRLRDLQDRTGGFQAFIPLPYIQHERPLSAIDHLKIIAISRLVLDNFDHIKAYWVMLGERLAQISLLWGADDFEGTVMEEKISHEAGAITPQSLTVEEIVELIKKAGRIPAERDSFYNIIKCYS